MGEDGRECFCICVVFGRHILWGHKDWYCEVQWSAFSVMNVRAKTSSAIRDVSHETLNAA